MAKSYCIRILYIPSIKLTLNLTLFSMFMMEPSTILMMHITFQNMVTSHQDAASIKQT